MRLLYPRDMRALSSILAMIMLLASVRLGTVIVCAPSHPQLSVDICHPVQTFNHASNLSIARPAAALPERVAYSFYSIVIEITARIIDHPVGPESPPPKRFV